MMLVLEIEFLTGRYVAKEYNDHHRAEWPPHPARVYSAFVAAHYEDPPDSEAARQREREALAWLAKQPPPDIYAGEASRYNVLDAFVPTNDKSVRPEVTRVVNELLEAEHKGDKRAVRRMMQRLQKLNQQAMQPVTNPNREVLKRAVSVLPTAPERKQPRTFPSVYPDDPVVQMAWPEEPTQDLRAALERLVERVTRLGHSSSLVRLAWMSSPREPTWIADETGAHKLRWVSPSQLQELESAFTLHGGVRNRVLPWTPANYRRADDPEPSAPVPGTNVFSDRDWVVFELQGNQRLPIVRAVDVATALRGAVIRAVHEEVCGCDFWQGSDHTPPFREARRCYEKIPSAISGHEADGSVCQNPHIAFVALPFVGSTYADGSILGVAAVLPLGLAGEDRRRMLRALGRVKRLALSPGLSFTIGRVAEPQPHLRTLDPSLWCGEGIVWGTVTPILLDRFPGNLWSRNPDTARRAEQEAEQAIAAACERIGLPKPRVVSLSAPCFRGSVAADRFRRRDRRGLPPRVRVHALIDFGTAIRGPVLLGAGRYVGLGLCRPLREERA